jgi:hypothetical protein
MKPMKIRFLLTLLGLAISFALPGFAQQKDTADPRVVHGQRRSLDRLRMRFLGLGFEALKLDFLDDGRDIGEINLLDGGFDNGIHFARESTLARS